MPQQRNVRHSALRNWDPTQSVRQIFQTFAHAEPTRHLNAFFQKSEALALSENVHKSNQKFAHAELKHTTSSTFPFKIRGTATKRATNCPTTCGTGTSTICSQILSKICPCGARFTTTTISFKIKSTGTATKTFGAPCAKLLCNLWTRDSPDMFTHPSKNTHTRRTRLNTSTNSFQIVRHWHSNKTHPLRFRDFPHAKSNLLPQRVLFQTLKPKLRNSVLDDPSLHPFLRGQSRHFNDPFQNFALAHRRFDMRPVAALAAPVQEA